VNKEAKARYWAVKIRPQSVVTPGKQNNNNNNVLRTVKKQAF